jgi:hypothetical protein
MAAAGKVARNIGRERRLADATLGIGDHNHRHANLLRLELVRIVGTLGLLFRYGNGMDSLLT